MLRFTAIFTAAKNMEDLVYEKFDGLLYEAKSTETVSLLNVILDKIIQMTVDHATTIDFDRLLQLGYFEVMYKILCTHNNSKTLYNVTHILCNLSFASEAMTYIAADLENLVTRLMQFIPRQQDLARSDYKVSLADNSCWILSNILNDNPLYVRNLYAHNIVDRLVTFRNGIQYSTPADSDIFETMFNLTGRLLKDLEPRHHFFVRPLAVMLADALLTTANPKVLSEISTSLGNMMLSEFSDYQDLLPAISKWTVENCLSSDATIKNAATWLLRRIAYLPDEVSEILITSGVFSVLPELMDEKDYHIQTNVLYTLTNLCTTTQTLRIGRLIELGCFERIFNVESPELFSDEIAVEYLKVHTVLLQHARDDQLQELLSRGMLKSLQSILAKLPPRDHIFVFFTV